MIAPPLTWRIHGHFALTAHWAILAAIWSYFKLNSFDNNKSENKNSIFFLQLAIIIITSGIHPYIAVMSFSLIVVSYLDQLAQNRIKMMKAFTSISIITLSLITGWYLFGYLPSPSSNILYGYGKYSLNLNSIFNPMSFSSFLKSLPVQEYQYEGFNYLGLGILLLLLSNCIVIIIKQKINICRTVISFIKNHTFLCLLLIILTGFALSNQIYWQNILIFEYPLPIGMEKIAAAFRAGGRFFWIVHYLILLGVLVTSFKLYPHPYLKIILVLIISLQFLDLIPLHHSSGYQLKAGQK